MCHLVAFPALWCTIPPNIRSAPNLASFCWVLKTRLFFQACGWEVVGIISSSNLLLIGLVFAIFHFCFLVCFYLLYFALHHWTVWKTRLGTDHPGDNFNLCGCWESRVNNDLMACNRFYCVEVFIGLATQWKSLYVRWGSYKSNT